MAATLILTVRTPEAEIISDEVNSLKVMTEGGEIEIYPHHSSLTGAIRIGKLYVRTDKEEIEFLVQRGIIFVDVASNSTQILCFSCKPVQDIEYASAKEYLDFVESQLKAGSDLNDFQLKYLEDEKIAMVQQLEMIEKN